MAEAGEPGADRDIDRGRDQDRKHRGTGGRLTFAAIASTLSATVAVIGTSWFNAARLNIDQADLAMRYAQFVSQPEDKKPSLEDKAFVARAMATAGFLDLSEQVRREARDAELRSLDEQKLGQKVHPSLNIGIPDLTVGQLETIMMIIQIAETGTIERKYGMVAASSYDPNGLSYGMHQASLGSGNLHAVIAAYVETPGAREAEALRPYLPRMASNDKALTGDAKLKDILKRAGSDPVMATTQIKFFLGTMYGPAFENARDLGFRLPLSFAVIADSHVHGSFALIAKRVDEAVGKARAGNEKAWITAYVAARKDWFANHPNKILHNSTYRMETYERLIAADNWQLALPFSVLISGGEVALAPEDIEGTALVRSNTDAILAEILAKDADIGPAFFQRAGAGLDKFLGLNGKPTSPAAAMDDAKPQAEPANNSPVTPVAPAAGAGGPVSAAPH
jgi:hypothetical protein